MSTRTRLMALTAGLTLLATGVYAGVEAKNHHHWQGPKVHRQDSAQYGRRNSGSAYGHGFTNCINSGHPEDFCQEVSRDFR